MVFPYLSWWNGYYHWNLKNVWTAYISQDELLKWNHTDLECFQIELLCSKRRKWLIIIFYFDIAGTKKIRKIVLI